MNSGLRSLQGESLWGQRVHAGHIHITNGAWLFNCSKIINDFFFPRRVLSKKPWPALEYPQLVHTSQLFWGQRSHTMDGQH